MRILGPTASVAAIGVIVLCCGCVNAMNGRVDGDVVGPARDAVYDEAKYSFMGYEVQVLMLVVTGVPNACEVWEELGDVETDDGCDDYCEDLHAIATEYLHHNEYWNLTVWLYPDDDIDVEYDHGSTLGEDEFTAGITLMDVSLLRDVDECEEECEDGDTVIDEDTEDAEDGTVTVTRYERKEMLQGVFDIEFDSEDEVVDGRFKAEYCDLGLESWSFFHGHP